MIVSGDILGDQSNLADIKSNLSAYNVLTVKQFLKILISITVSENIDIHLR